MTDEQRIDEQQDAPETEAKQVEVADEDLEGVAGGENIPSDTPFRSTGSSPQQTRARYLD